MQAVPDTEGSRSHVRPLLHESTKGEPEGIQKVILVSQLLRLFDTVAGLLPLVGGEPGQDIDNKSDQDKYKESTNVDLNSLEI